MSSDILPPSVPVGAQPDAVIANNIRPLSGVDVQAGKDSKKFDQTLQDYEGVYLSQMVSHMYEGVEVDPQFGGGVGEETMRSLLINEYGKQMAASGGIGLASAMKKQLLAAQEQATNPQLAPVSHPAAANAASAITPTEGTNDGSNTAE
jgi:Rod binding domain-containing protein